MEKLTQDEKMKLIRIINGDGINLMRAQYDDRDVAVIVDMQAQEHEITAEPLAILVDQSFFEELTPPLDPLVAQETEQATLDN